MHLIWAIFTFYSSFGAVCTTYYTHACVAGCGDAIRCFARYEIAYLALSAISKTYLMVTLMSAVFEGELRWLQACGYGCPAVPFA